MPLRSTLIRLTAASAAALLSLLVAGAASASFLFSSGVNTVSDTTYEGTALIVTTPILTVAPTQTELTLNGTAIVGPEDDVTGNMCTGCVFDPTVEGQGMRIDAAGGGLLDLGTFAFVHGTGSLVTIDGASVAVKNDVPTGSTNFADAVTVGGGAVLTMESGEIGRDIGAGTGDVVLVDSATFIMNGGTVWGDVEAAGFAQVTINGGQVVGDTDVQTDMGAPATLIAGDAQLVVNGGLLNDVELTDFATMIMTAGTLGDDLLLLGSSRADVSGGEILGSDPTPVTSQPTIEVAGAGALLVLYGDNFFIDGVAVVFGSVCPEGTCAEFTNSSFGLPTIDVDGDLVPDFNGISGALEDGTSPFSDLTIQVGSPLNDTAKLRLVQAPLSVIPEPATALLLGLGLAGLGISGRRRS